MSNKFKAGDIVRISNDARYREHYRRYDVLNRPLVVVKATARGDVDVADLYTGKVFMYAAGDPLAVLSDDLRHDPFLNAANKACNPALDTPSSARTNRKTMKKKEK